MKWLLITLNTEHRMFYPGHFCYYLTVYLALALCSVCSGHFNDFSVCAYQ